MRSPFPSVASRLVFSHTNTSRAEQSSATSGWLAGCLGFHPPLRRPPPTTSATALHISHASRSTVSPPPCSTSAPASPPSCPPKGPSGGLPSPQAHGTTAEGTSTPLPSTIPVPPSASASASGAGHVNDDDDSVAACRCEPPQAPASASGARMPHDNTAAYPEGAPSSAVALPTPVPAPGRMLGEYSGVVAVTVYKEVFNGTGNELSSSAPLPSFVPPGQLLEESSGAVPVTAYPEACHGRVNKSSSLLPPSPAVAVPAPEPGWMVQENNAAVPVSTYTEVCLGIRDKPSFSAPLPSPVQAVPTPASGWMLEDNSVVSVTAYPEAGHVTGKKKTASPPSAEAVAPGPGRMLEDYAKEWAARKLASGAPLQHCVLPFLTGAPKAVECRVCYKIIHPLEEIKCSVSRCEQPFHLTCVAEYTANFTAESFRCPQHGCMVCKQKMFFWRCGRCTVAAHTKCAPWPLIHLKDDQGSAICWRHPSNWLLQNENADLTNNIEEAFCRLPLPYVNEEFNIDSTIRNFSAIVCKPPSYTHIKRNVYLVKKKRADSSAETGCRNCRADSVCRDDCECRGLSMSCSKSCRCSDLCSNKPFRKDKKFKIVKSEGCGWGAVALEPLEKGDFIIEYVGEVINDATCEQRLWEMKRRGDKNFYMCEISKDCTIDATFKGNTSRFLNHSCDPNCKLEKWQVEGETRVGVFASRTIKVGEPLTYDYRFVHFGERVKCNCGARSCQGYLGIQLKNPTQDALAAPALENQGGSPPSRLIPETHLLPWTNCIEVPFNLRSKTKIDRLCWGRKRQRTSIIDPSSSSVMKAAAPVPRGFVAELS